VSDVDTAASARLTVISAAQTDQFCARRRLPSATRQMSSVIIDYTDRLRSTASEHTQRDTLDVDYRAAGRFGPGRRCRSALLTILQHYFLNFAGPISLVNVAMLSSGFKFYASILPVCDKLQFCVVNVIFVTVEDINQFYSLGVSRRQKFEVILTLCPDP